MKYLQLTFGVYTLQNDVEIITYYIEVQTVLFESNSLGLVINYGIRL